MILPKEICLVLGTRPEIIKLSPIIKSFENNRRDFFVVHTGQHFDYNMDTIFFKELGLSPPAYNLGVGSGTHGQQTAKIIEKVEEVFLKRKPILVVVQGDTNSALAAALAATKLQIPVAHIEAGLRSYDRTMPEEVNRVLIDHMSSLLFSPTEGAKKNLLREGIREEKITVAGNTIVDALEESMSIIKRKRINEKINENLIFEHEFENINWSKYVLLTLHRQENTDNKQRLENICTALDTLASQNIKIVYPIHPRTKKMLEKFRMKLKDLKIIEPVGYFDFLVLEKNAQLIITDSGGVQEEACILGVPCVTVRNNTERPETVEVGANIIAGVETETILQAVRTQLNKMHTWQQPFGVSGTVAKKIEAVIIEYIVSV